MFLVITIELLGIRSLSFADSLFDAVFDLGEQRMIVQPGMTGGLLVHSPKPIGEAARYNVLTIRMDDGSNVQPTPFTFGTQPGDYQSTPPNFPTQPQFTHWSAVRPFVLARARSGNAFLLEA